VPSARSRTALSRGRSPPTSPVEIVRVVEEFGLQPVESPGLPEKITVEQLGVVCWMAVLSPS
jgi:hypothetical protein